MASAYAARDYQSLQQYFIVREKAVVFFYDAEAADAQNSRLGMKPYFKQAKDNGYDCAHIGNHLIPQLRSQHNIKSLMGAIFFSYGKYIRHTEGLAGDIFQAQQQLPVYPMMKPDSVDGHAPQYMYQKPNEIDSPTTYFQKPNAVDSPPASPQVHKPDAADDYRLSKPLPSLPPQSQPAQPAQQAPASTGECCAIL